MKIDILFTNIFFASADAAIYFSTSNIGGVVVSQQQSQRFLFIIDLLEYWTSFFYSSYSNWDSVEIDKTKQLALAST